MSKRDRANKLRDRGLNPRRYKTACVAHRAGGIPVTAETWCYLYEHFREYHVEMRRADGSVSQVVFRVPDAPSRQP